MSSSRRNYRIAKCTAAKCALKALKYSLTTQCCLKTVLFKGDSLNKQVGRSRSYHGKCGGERRNPTRYGEEMWTSPSKHSWRKRKTSEYRDSRWREDTRNIKQWRKETVLSAKRRIQELRKSFPRSTETSVKESTRSQRYEGRNYKDLREIIRKKRQGRENVGSSSQLEKGSLSCLSED